MSERYDAHIVELDPLLRDWLAAQTTAAGWRTRCAPDIGSLDDETDASDSSAGAQPRWLLVDLDESAPDSLKRLNEYREGHPGTRVLMIASHIDPVRLLAWLRSWIGRLLAKPFTRGELLGALGLQDRYIESERETILPWMPSSSKIRRGVKDWLEMETVSAPGLEAWLSRWIELYLSHHVPENKLRDIRVAVGEMLGNAVEWGNGNNPDAKIYLSCALFPDQVIITIEDEGKGFTPADVPSPDNNPFEVMRMRKAIGKRVGGYGLHLARKVSSDFFYNHKGNRVMLIWRFPPLKPNANPSRQPTGKTDA